MLAKHNIGFEIRGDQLVLRGTEPGLVEVQVAAPTLAEQSVPIIQESLQRASERLHQGRGREAVQESLWLLESVSTVFKGVDTQTGSIEGGYFNQIVRELRNAHRGGTLDRVLEWAMGVHGYSHRQPEEVCDMAWTCYRAFQSRRTKLGCFVT